MLHQLRTALRAGIVSEPAPLDADLERLGARLGA